MSPLESTRISPWPLPMVSLPSGGVSALAAKVQVGSAALSPARVTVRAQTAPRSEASMVGVPMGMERDGRGVGGTMGSGCRRARTRWQTRRSNYAIAYATEDRTAPASRQQRLDDLGLLHAGELGVEALVAVGQALVVEAELVEDRRVEVADVDGILDDVVAEVVGLAVDVALVHAG